MGAFRGLFKLLLGAFFSALFVVFVVPTQNFEFYQLYLILTGINLASWLIVHYAVPEGPSRWRKRTIQE